MGDRRGLGAGRARTAQHDSSRRLAFLQNSTHSGQMGAALLAPDPASRWLQAKRADFDLDELLPAPPARLTALRAASDGQAPVDALGTTSSGQTPDFFTSSVTAQLQAAGALAAPVHGAQGGNPPTPNSPTTVHALHIVGSMILQPVGDHGGDGAVGRGGEAQKSAIRTHMAEWMADNAAAIDPGQRGIVSSYLGDGGARYRIFLPELAAAVMPNEEAGSPIPTDFPAGALRASGPLGRVLARRRGAGAERYPREWTPFLDLLEEAAGPVWMNDLPGEGGPIAGLGLSLLARASALAAKVSRQEPTSVITDLHHLIGAVLAPADAALPPAFEPFPAFRRDMPSSERQAIRRRFLHIIQQYPTASNRSERRTVWTDVILGERLVTARIPTDLRPIDDLLGFRRYANAFASVIADEHVSPPLAIGLFGPWGSGKSAMIDMIDAALQDIDARAAFDEEPRFCRGIVRVVFNAWHYAETNLWASLFVRILEAMAAHLRATPPPTPHDERDTSLRELEEAKEQQRIADAEVARVELEAARAAEDKAKADQDLTEAHQAEADVTAAIAGKVRAAEAAQSTRLNALEVAGDAAALLFAFGRPTAADLAGATGQQLEVTLKKQLAAVSELTKSLKNLSDPCGVWS